MPVAPSLTALATALSLAVISTDALHLPYRRAARPLPIARPLAAAASHQRASPSRRRAHTTGASPLMYSAKDERTTQEIVDTFSASRVEARSDAGSQARSEARNEVVTGARPRPMGAISTPLSTGIAFESWARLPVEQSDESGRNPTAKPPLVFIHGSFHGGWCWDEHWLPYFAARGYPSYAVSLRGTSGSPSPPGVKSVKVGDVVADIAAWMKATLPADGPAPVLVAHSFGSISVMKFLEAQAMGSTPTPPVSGAAILCGVPPSGNGPMTQRFIKVHVNRLCRELFFGDSVPEPGGDAAADAQLARYMSNFQADSKVGLDLVDLTQNELPSLRADPQSGRAEWLSSGGGGSGVCRVGHVDVYVLGAKQDYLVDEEGVAETARFFGQGYEMVDVAHDVMLGDTWEDSAEKLENWLATLK